jgi:hypothetical protein
MMNWIVPFIIGIFVGQEYTQIPRIKPIAVMGYNKLLESLKKD